ncbi:hypothetical protein ELH84_09185 [Rhizobium ruizarguesonis]|nr:hypothetical protein [Rhizobium leguminosarum bv. viciae]TAY74043.1 hypothetical protein ELH84_09185 [Rhizobium ruizarguesonis]
MTSDRIGLNPIIKKTEHEVVRKPLRLFGIMLGTLRFFTRKLWLSTSQKYRTDSSILTAW